MRFGRCPQPDDKWVAIAHAEAPIILDSEPANHEQSSRSFEIGFGTELENEVLARFGVDRASGVIRKK